MLRKFALSCVLCKMEKHGGIFFISNFWKNGHISSINPRRPSFHKMFKHTLKFTAWKVSKYGVFLVPIFLHSVWIQKNTDQKNFVFGNFSRSEKLTANGASCFFSRRRFFKETDQVLFTTFAYFHCSFNIFNPLMQKLPKWPDTLKILQEKLQIFQSMPGHFGIFCMKRFIVKIRFI